MREEGGGTREEGRGRRDEGGGTIHALSYNLQLQSIDTYLIRKALQKEKRNAGYFPYVFLI